MRKIRYLNEDVNNSLDRKKNEKRYLVHIRQRNTVCERERK